jgi:mRNA-decapping enzyme subunit 2
MAVFSNGPCHLSNPSSGAHISSPPQSRSTVTPGSVTSQSPSTKSPTHSRRSSLVTADLSPYLARPAGIPMNGKRLRQLALLEAVADESSRMTPAPSTRFGTQPLLPHQVSTPIDALHSPNTVTSHNFTNLSPMYSNTHGPYMPVLQTGPFNPPSPDNIFTVRPRTSNAFRPVPNHPTRSFNTRGSMNQAQLLSVLSGTSYPSTPGHHRPPIPPMPNLSFHTPSPYPVPPMSTVATVAPVFRTGPHPPPLRVLPSQAISGPTAVQGLPSTPGGPSKFGFSHPTANSQNSQLLSILNRGAGQ